MSSIAAFLAAALASAPVPAGTQVEATGPLAPLKGTLLAPAAKSGATVLIIPGSGPTDRDGNNPMGVAAAPYRMLAEALAERGVTTVRIDKRGMFGSKAAVADGNAVTIADYAADVRAWVKAARERTGASCVWVLGHSEGGLVALAAGQQPDGMCGLVVVSAPGRRLGETIRRQLRANPANAPVLPQAMAALDSLEAGKRVDTADMHPALLPLFAPQVQGFLIDLLSYDPPTLAARVRVPVLTVQGERDLQVLPDDARALAAADPKAKLVMIPGANHVLKPVGSDDRAANFATYADPALPLAPGIADVIAAFVTGQAAR
jgi:pimeloyl-ACP methyl ester carboxylesterase